MQPIAHWRARIGWIHPRVNSDIEVYDFYQAAPKDVVLVITHLEVVDSASKKETDASLELIERAVERLNMAGVDFIMIKGSPVYLRYGNSGYQQVLERMRAVAKAPVTSSSQALVDAFHHLSAKRILFVPSWRSETTDLLDNKRNFFLNSGIEIAAVEGMGLQLQSFEKNKITPLQIYNGAVSAFKKNPDVDAVYIQSGTMATVGIIEELEKELNKPVVSSNTANIWGSFKPLNIKVGSGFGRLLGSL